jgi:hypothetical protein
MAKNIVEALDDAGLAIPAALWFYMADSDQWLFMLATPLVDVRGPKMAYKKVQSALKKIPEESRLTLKDILVVSPNNDLIELLRTAVKTQVGIRFSRNTINNTLIDDAYIYRMR